MANRKNNLSKPSKLSKHLNNDVRFNFGSGKSASGFFAVYTSRRNQVGTDKFNNVNDAVAYAVTLQ